jgi:hypothetical protein
MQSGMSVWPGRADHLARAARPRRPAGCRR